jgi:hypothetical protein
MIAGMWDIGRRQLTSLEMRAISAVTIDLYIGLGLRMAAPFGSSHRIGIMGVKILMSLRQVQGDIYS